MGKFQAIRHKIAEMALKAETGRAVTYNALRLFAEGHDAIKEVTIAKLKTQRDAFEIADEALQIFGGAGFIRGIKVERIYRETKVLSIGGGAEERRLGVARLPGAQPVGVAYPGVAPDAYVAQPEWPEGHRALGQRRRPAA